jgi:hypothetical protein
MGESSAKVSFSVFAPSKVLRRELGAATSATGMRPCDKAAANNFCCEALNSLRPSSWPCALRVTRVAPSFNANSGVAETTGATEATGNGWADCCASRGDSTDVARVQTTNHKQAAVAAKGNA